MTRAQLAAMWAYQPRRRPSLGVAFWIVSMCAVVVVVWGFFLITSCTPAETRAAGAQAEVTLAVGEYGAAILKCRLDAADGGTFRSFQACACGVDRDHNLDAAGAGAECP